MFTVCIGPNSCCLTLTATAANWLRHWLKTSPAPHVERRFASDGNIETRKVKTRVLAGINIFLLDEGCGERIGKQWPYLTGSAAFQPGLSHLLLTIEP